LPDGGCGVFVSFFFGRRELAVEPQETPIIPFHIRLWRFASSTWLGVGLMVALAVVLGIVSVVDQLSPDLSVLPDRSGAYGHWSVVALILATCASLFLATMRIPLRWDRAGAWCSHLGLILLACGSMFFWLDRTEGYCVSFAQPGGRWPMLQHFFQAHNKMAFHVYDRSLMVEGRLFPPTFQTVMDSPDGIEPLDLNVPIEDSPEGVSMKAVRLYPQAELRNRWLDDSPNPSPAVELQISHGGVVSRTIMAKNYHDTHRIITQEYLIFFQSGEPPPQEKIDADNARPPSTQPAREWFIIYYTGSGRPVLVTRDAHGKMQKRDFGPGQSAESSHPDHPVRIELVSTMNHARRGIQVTPIRMIRRERSDDLPMAAIELEIQAGSWKARRVVRFSQYLSDQYHSRPERIDLPQNRAVHVAFSQRWLEFEERLGITAHEFKTAPASRMPEDYICDVEIGKGIYTRNETLKLNYPVSIGKYRIYQSDWRWNPDNPHATGPFMIVFGVGDRPGIWLIFIGGFMICLGFPYAFYVKPLILRARTGGKS